MAVESDNLTVRQARAIKALLESPTVSGAAELAGVGERSIYRWLQVPEFIAALRRAESGAIGDAVRSLIVELRDNHQVMKQVRDDDESTLALRLRAAQVYDASLLKWRVLSNQETRIAELEEKFIQLLERAENYERSRAKR